MADIRKLPFRQPPRLIPKKLIGITYTCQGCRRKNIVDWHSPQPFPKQPITPNSGDGFWVPASISQKCDCGVYSDVEFPNRQTISTWDLFGDEAERVFAPGDLPGVTSKAHFFSITLVGLHSDGQIRLQKRLLKLKKMIRPDWDPASWPLHLTEIWGGSPGNAGYAMESKAKKIEFARQLAGLMSISRPHLFTLHFSSCRIQMPEEDWAQMVKGNKQEVFAAALLTSLEQFRERKLGIHWNFDHSVNPEKRTGSEGWAEEVFLGLQYTPLFTWISSGAVVLPPRFHEPGSHYLLEIADALSFFAARDFQQRAVGRASEFPSSLTGLGFYQAFDTTGGIHSKWSRGLPFESFYPRLVVAP